LAPQGRKGRSLKTSISGRSKTVWLPL